MDAHDSGCSTTVGCPAHVGCLHDKQRPKTTRSTRVLSTRIYTSLSLCTTTDDANSISTYKVYSSGENRLDGMRTSRMTPVEKLSALGNCVIAALGVPTPHGYRYASPIIANPPLSHYFSSGSCSPIATALDNSDVPGYRPHVYFVLVNPYPTGKAPALSRSPLDAADARSRPHIALAWCLPVVNDVPVVVLYSSSSQLYSTNRGGTV